MQHQRATANSTSKKKDENLKKQQYDEVVSVVMGVCRTKGWDSWLVNEDSNFQFITIQISKYLSNENVTGIINLTVHDGVKLQIEKTSFHQYGQSDLLDSISLKLGELKWLEAEKKKNKEPEPSYVLDLVLRNFDKIARQMKRRYDGRLPFQIQDEYDVQDLLHGVLRGYFKDVRPEEYTPSYAGSASRVDFLLKLEKIVIEVKFATKKLKEKALGDQLIIDIKKYQTHPDCGTLYCFVYDPEGNIRNPAGIEADLSGKHNDLSVKVFIVPH